MHHPVHISAMLNTAAAASCAAEYGEAAVMSMLKLFVVSVVMLSGISLGGYSG